MINSRRRFVSSGAAVLGAAALGPSNLYAAKPKIRWRMQTYASRVLATEVVQPAIDSFNRIAGEEMQIELYFADQIVSTDGMFAALQNGTLDAVQSDDDSMASPTEVSVFGGYFPFGSRNSLDIPVLFNEYGLNEIWDAEYARLGVKHLSAGAWDPCHFATKTPIRTLADLKGKKILTFPTAGRFMSQFGVVPVSVPLSDVAGAVRAGSLDGIAWSGITENYTVGWADVMDYFLTNSISGAWTGSFFANMSSYRRLPPHLQELLKLTMDSSHYHRQWWYWGGEARLRTEGNKMAMTTIADEEWALVEMAALKFWDEIASESEVKAKVVSILKDYNSMMLRAGSPYR